MEFEIRNVFDGWFYPNGDVQSGVIFNFGFLPFYGSIILSGHGGSIDVFGTNYFWWCFIYKKKLEFTNYYYY